MRHYKRPNVHSRKFSDETSHSPPLLHPLFPCRDFTGNILLLTFSTSGKILYWRYMTASTIPSIGIDFGGTSIKMGVVKGAEVIAHAPSIATQELSLIHIFCP